MITLRSTTAVQDDRRVVLTLPQEVPLGQVELVVTVESHTPDEKGPRTVVGEPVEARPKHDDADRVRYPLRGTVVRFEQPT